MILKISVKNFRSINDQQTLSLTASSLKDFDSGLITGTSINQSLLPAAILYGANASGKSNFIKAVEWIVGAVVSSHNRSDPDGKIPRDAFALNSKTKNQPTSLSLDFLLSNVRYHYSLEATNNAFISEALYSFPNGRKNILFERKNQKFSFGRNLKGKNKTIAELTRPNSLFLSAAAQNEHKQLKKIANYIKSIKVITNIEASPITINLFYKDKDLDKRILDFLYEAGTGIKHYTKLRKKLSEKAKIMRKDLFELLNKYASLDKAFYEEDDFEIRLGHETNEKAPVFFSLDDESEGTRRLLHMLGLAYDALKTGSPLFIDEMSSNLHTKVCDQVIALFNCGKLNKNGSQLIATTHDTNLLCSRTLRRDQIWFCEKDKNGATNIYPLTDFPTREGDNIEKGYLQGRFGAIPFSGSIDDIIGK